MSLKISILNWMRSAKAGKFVTIEGRPVFIGGPGGGAGGAAPGGSTYEIGDAVVLHTLGAVHSSRCTVVGKEEGYTVVLTGKADRRVNKHWIDDDGNIYRKMSGGELKLEKDAVVVDPSFVSNVPKGTTIPDNRVHANKGSRKVIDKAIEHIPQRHIDECVATIDVGGPSFTGWAGSCDAGGNIGLYGKPTRFSNSAGWTKRVVVHEIGHAVAAHYGGTIAVGRIFKALKERKAEFISLVARQNKDEFFAESYHQYINNPMRLFEMAPEMYSFMHTKIFDGVDYRMGLD